MIRALPPRYLLVDLRQKRAGYRQLRQLAPAASVARMAKGWPALLTRSVLRSQS